MLSMAKREPKRVLSSGTHAGFEWMVLGNHRGYRCGYVKLPKGHPWSDGGHYDIDCDVHGGTTYGERDEDDGCFWIGFDCQHAWDAPDPALPGYHDDWNTFGDIDRIVRTQEYVERECRNLCEQADAAKD